MKRRTLFQLLCAALAPWASVASEANMYFAPSRLPDNWDLATAEDGDRFMESLLANDGYIKLKRPWDEFDGRCARSVIACSL